MDPELLRALRIVIDPELGVDIVSLGLVYGATREDGRAKVLLTMTSPACPLGEVIIEDARTAITSLVHDVHEVDVELTFEPRWSPERMTPEAKEQLGYSE